MSADLTRREFLKGAGTATGALLLGGIGAAATSHLQATDRWQQLRSEIRGVLLYAITPFLPASSGGKPEVDLEGVRRNARYYGRIRGKLVVVVCAGTGEFDSLTPEENAAVVEAAREGLRGRHLLISGVGGDTEQAIQMTRSAAEAGADAVLVMPDSSVASRGEEAIADHIRSIAEAVEIGVVPYHSAPFSVSPQAVAAWTDVPNVVAIKDGSSNLTIFRDIVLAVRGKVPISTGGEDTAPYYFLAGAAAMNTGIGCLVPQISLGQYEAARVRDYEKCLALRDRVMPLFRFRAQHGNTVVKAGLELMGLAGGPVRNTGATLGQPEREELRRLLLELGTEL